MADDEEKKDGDRVKCRHANEPSLQKQKPERKIVDGNWAVASASYRMNDVAYIFPITPSSTMGEIVDAWASNNDNNPKKMLNLWDQELKVCEMQSEGGAAGALHGALVSGSLATTYTASQGLLLFIPNLYKIAGELLPTVIHVAARALTGQALSIYGDHSDVMLVRATGLAMVSSFTVQEAHDMAIVCQIATLNSRVPFLHFMDGFRTSHEINKIELVSDDILRELMPWDKVEEHRQRALSPMHPSQRGTAQAPDVFMQLVESSNTHYQMVSSIFEQALADFSLLTGRKYSPFEYHYFGSSKPLLAIVTMGSSVEVVKETLKHIKSEQVCLIGVRLFRPWSTSSFCNALPQSVKRVATLDRTKECGAQGEPLYTDCVCSLMAGKRGHVFVAGGRYGLASKDFSPRMVMSVINNLMRNDVERIQHPFTVGIIDDVTHLSLPLGKEVTPLPESVTQCVFWGFGSDGTVGANHEAVKIIGEYRPDMSVQAYFEYDAKKSSGWTISHLRFSNTDSDSLSAPYRVQDGRAHYVACHNESYVEANKFDVVKFIRKGGTFFLNTKIAALPPDRRLKALESKISPKVLRTLAQRNIKFYIMDAASLAAKYGLKGKINMICMSAFFRLSGVLPIEEAISLLKKSITKTYSYKGEDVVRKNHELLDACSDPQFMIAVDIPSRWKRATLTEEKRAYSKRHVALIDDEKTRKFMEDIAEPVRCLEGDSIPISKFLENHMLGGVMQPGTTRYEKRRPNPSNLIPTWNANACTQCNQCVAVCPHAAIRPFIVTREEAENAPHPSHFSTVKALGTELAGKRYTLQISPLDCTGCNACVEACPESPKALEMGDVEAVLLSGGEQNWEYADKLPERGDLVDKYTLKGSQFQVPLMEFSGACSGCGETPYFKMLTQLFGERMVIANATGCSTIWGGSFPSNPYTVSKKTLRGPAWANSLFEDNAEYGFGMFSAMRHRRERLIKLVEEYVHDHELSDNADKDKEEMDLVALFHEWLDCRDEKTDKCTILFDKMKPLFQFLLFDANKGAHTRHYFKLEQIYSDRDMFPKLSQWIVGGDGWAYDIGYGGLDHVEAFAANDVNVLVVDTEMYSNTGGQQSKATPAGASVKFAVGGKQQTKKPMGEIFMTYEHVYVASVCLSNQAHLLQALIEADRHPGPSFIVAYAPCIQQQVRPEGLNDMFDECRYAVDSGYWPLYRYNPGLIDEGKNPFILDSKKLRREVTSFLKREGRFINLRKKHPEIADELFEKMNRDVHHRMELMLNRASGYKQFSTKDEASVQVLFASETGTAQRLARDFSDACTLSHGADCLNDIDPDDLDCKTSIFFIATCGQGAMPQNGGAFYKALCARKEPFPEGTTFAVMGLGDSSYYFFCKAAKELETAMLNLGAKCILPMGTGDDAAAEGLEEGLHQWLDKVWPCLDLDPPKEVPHIIPTELVFSKRAVIPEKEDDKAISQYYESLHAKSIPVSKVQPLSEGGHNRDFISFTLDTGHDLVYEPGDSLEIFPSNDPIRVVEFLHEYSPDYDERTVIKLNRSFGIHGEVSLGSLFTNVLDLFGKPTMHFLQQLATFESNDVTRQSILDVETLKKMSLEEGVTFADLLLLYKSVHPPLPALLAMIPPIKGRAYSITSAPSSSPDSIELCILIDTWWCEEGMRYGLTCDMLRKLHEGDSIWCRVKPGSMEPPTHKQPVVCVGIGSGLAPHLAFLRDRVHAANVGMEVAPFSLYFGNRFEAREFLYRSELEQIAADHGSWFKLHTAFSRDTVGKKVYVQDLVAITEDAYNHLLKNQGMLYVCGNRSLPKPLQNSLKVSFARGMADETSIEEAAKAVEDLFVHGRAQQEVW
ncbi:hypothetical protein ACHAXR_013545 [Thalassiosira sp. AJA248-18]